MSFNKDYEHYIKEVPLVDFLGFTNRYLVKSLEELDYLLNTKYKDKQFMSFDIETTGLDPENDFLVGYSFAFDAVDGYYVPTNHSEEPRLGVESLQLIYDRMLLNKKNFVYNGMFDLNFFELEGQLRAKRDWDFTKVPYYDVMVGVFLADTNVPFPSLKKSAKRFIGWNMDNFDATLGDNYNFHFVPPEEAFDYGALDAISTFALAPVSLQFYKESKLSGKIDNDFIYPFSTVLRDGIRHDVKLLESMISEQEKDLKELENEIYRIAGKVFKINSPKGLSDVLMGLGIHTGQTTKTGYMKTDLECLDNAKAKYNHPMLDVLMAYKKLNKAVGSYTKPLYINSKDKDEGRMRYCYHLFRAPTCRLACGKDKKNPYFTPINEQSIPKPKGADWFVHDYKEGDIVLEDDVVILDWRFSLTDKSDFIVEGMSPKGNLRNALLPEKNHYWLSMDYSAEELRLIANYSKEPMWCSTFINGGDLHRTMAGSIFHKKPEEVTGGERKKAKSANFGLAYGMSPFTMVGRFKLPLQECEELHHGWWKSVPHIKAFQQRSIKFAKSKGTIYNYFGRPRRLKYYFRGDRKQVSFGERTVRNTIIQSMGADIFKVAFLNLYKRLYTNPKYKDYCRFLSTIHDEINTSLDYTDRDRFMEMLDIHYNCMYMKIKGWDVPFDVGVELGLRWGHSFPFTYDPVNKVLAPDMKAYKPKEEIKPEEEEESVNSNISEDLFDIDSIDFDINL